MAFSNRQFGGGLNNQVNDWVNQTAQGMPAFQVQQQARLAGPQQAAVLPAPVPGPVNTARPDPLPISTTAAPITPPAVPFDPVAFRQQRMDWRALRPDFSGGRPEDSKQLMMDWRSQRPMRPQWPGAVGFARNPNEDRNRY